VSSVDVQVVSSAVLTAPPVSPGFVRPASPTARLVAENLSPRVTSLAGPISAPPFAPDAHLALRENSTPASVGHRSLNAVLNAAADASQSLRAAPVACNAVPTAPPGSPGIVNPACPTSSEILSPCAPVVAGAVLAPRLTLDVSLDAHEGSTPGNADIGLRQGGPGESEANPPRTLAQSAGPASQTAKVATLNDDPRTAWYDVIHPSLARFGALAPHLRDVQARLAIAPPGPDFLDAAKSPAPFPNQANEAVLPSARVGQHLQLTAGCFPGAPHTAATSPTLPRATQVVGNAVPAAPPRFPGLASPAPDDAGRGSPSGLNNTGPAHGIEIFARLATTGPPKNNLADFMLEGDPPAGPPKNNPADFMLEGDPPAGPPNNNLADFMLEGDPPARPPKN
jgi:hypothetical protein